MPINPISTAQAANALIQTQSAATKAQPAAANSFSQALDSLSQSQNNSDALLQQLSAGENVDIHNVMIAAEQTDVTMRVALSMRDKLVDAYHEVMRMSI
jgi:flagellar hook-basal body complex protein FliE